MIIIKNILSVLNNIIMRIVSNFEIIIFMYLIFPLAAYFG